MYQSEIFISLIHLFVAFDHLKTNQGYLKFTYYQDYNVMNAELFDLYLFDKN